MDGEYKCLNGNIMVCAAVCTLTKRYGLKIGPSNNTVFGISLKPTFSPFLCAKFQKIGIQMYRSFDFPGIGQEGGHITLDPPLLFMGYFYLQIILSIKIELKFKHFIPGNFCLPFQFNTVLQLSAKNIQEALKYTNP